jgi:hypothetical protein
LCFPGDIEDTIRPVEAIREQTDGMNCFAIEKPQKIWVPIFELDTAAENGAEK